MFSKILKRLEEIKNMTSTPLAIMNACDADWSAICEKEKMFNVARVITIENLIKETVRSNEV